MRPFRWLSRIFGRRARPESQPSDGDGKARIKLRPIMDRVLKEIFVPELRARGFTKSLPHFRHIRADRVDLVTVQHSPYGREFVVELSQCGPRDDAACQGKPASPDKVTAHHLFSRDRCRLSFKPGGRGQRFLFDREARDAASDAMLEAACAEAARAALDAFTRQAEPWWEKKAAAMSPVRE